MIFDRFPSEVAALAFAISATCDLYGVQWSIHSNPESANAVDPFPYVLTPPIVLVDRCEDEDERKIESLVKHFGGVLAGT